MADAGDLQKFPFEIRNEIYKYLLGESHSVGIISYSKKAESRVGRIDHTYRKRQHRGEVYDRHQREWVAAPPGPSAILYVNKQLSQETKQILYGCNRFSFDHAGALENFLKQIGSDSMKYLRHIALVKKGILFRKSWATMDRCSKRLLEARSLRTLKIGRGAFCTEKMPLGTEGLVKHFKPLLEALQADFKITLTEHSPDTVMASSLLQRRQTADWHAGTCVCVSTEKRKRKTKISSSCMN